MLQINFVASLGGNAYKNRTTLSYHIYMPPDISVDAAFLARERGIRISKIVLLVAVVVSLFCIDVTRSSKTWLWWFLD